MPQQLVHVAKVKATHRALERRRRQQGRGPARPLLVACASWAQRPLDMLSSATLASEGAHAERACVSDGKKPRHAHPSMLFSHVRQQSHVGSKGVATLFPFQLMRAAVLALMRDLTLRS